MWCIGAMSSSSSQIQSTLGKVDTHREQSLPTPGENEVVKDIRNNRLLMRIGGVDNYDKFIEVIYDSETGFAFKKDATPMKIGFGDTQGFVKFTPSSG